MNIAGGHSGDMADTACDKALRSIQATRYSKLPLPRLVGASLLAAFVLFITSWLLPAALSLVALDLMSWCLVGALAAGTLFASVKLIESVLDL